jgi:hypothetical protein
MIEPHFLDGITVILRDPTRPWPPPLQPAPGSLIVLGVVYPFLFDSSSIPLPGDTLANPLPKVTLSAFVQDAAGHQIPGPTQRLDTIVRSTHPHPHFQMHWGFLFENIIPFVANSNPPLSNLLTVRVTATLASGTSDSDSRNFKLMAVPPSYQAPSVSVTYPTSGGHFSNSDTASGRCNQAATMNYWFPNGGSGGPGIAPPNNWTSDFTNVPNGNYTFYARASNGNGITVVTVPNVTVP